jgi:NAD(P)-dependent dehydrogenase (short-subunit alcohol dehydrogenase family)
MGRLDKKIAIVTGAGRGIGRAIATRLAEDGATIAVTDIDESLGKETLSKLKSLSPDSMSFKLDVTKENQIKACIHKIIARYGNIDILVNNAGVSTMGRFNELTTDEWDFNMNINAKGAWLVTKHVAPILMKNKKGKIIMVASMAGKLAAPFLAHYSASKFAVIGLVQAISKELADYNINVNAVCPGWVKTPMQDREVIWEARIRGFESPEDVRKEYVSMTPLKRLCQPEDVANVVSFLASEDSNFMTGQALNVTGGACVH